MSLAGGWPMTGNAPEPGRSASPGWPIAGDDPNGLEAPADGCPIVGGGTGGGGGAGAGGGGGGGVAEALAGFDRDGRSHWKPESLSSFVSARWPEPASPSSERWSGAPTRTVSTSGAWRWDGMKSALDVYEGA
jgi:hypothetical protein